MTIGIADATGHLGPKQRKRRTLKFSFASAGTEPLRSMPRIALIVGPPGAILFTVWSARSAALE